MPRKEWPYGRKIVGAKVLTAEEMEKEGWDSSHGYCEPCTALILDDGSLIYPSQDHEGNGPGALFAARGKSKVPVTICAVEKQTT